MDIGMARYEIKPRKFNVIVKTKYVGVCYTILTMFPYIKISHNIMLGKSHLK